MRNKVKSFIFYASLALLIELNYAWFKNTWLAERYFDLQSEPTLDQIDQIKLKAYFPFRSDIFDHSKGKTEFILRSTAGENNPKESIWLHLPVSQDLNFVPRLVQNKNFGLVGLGANKTVGGSILGTASFIDISEGEWSQGLTIAGGFIAEKPTQINLEPNYYEVAGLHDAKGPLLSLLINTSSVFNYLVNASSSEFYSFPNDIDWERPIYFVLIIDNKIGRVRMYLNGRLVLDQAANFRPISGMVTLQVGKKQFETDPSYLRLIQELSIWGESLTDNQALNLSKKVLNGHAKASKAIQKVNGLILLLVMLSFFGCLVCNPFYPSKRSSPR